MRDRQPAANLSMIAFVSLFLIPSAMARISAAPENGEDQPGLRVLSGGTYDGSNH
jgi:hypothetical protein